MSCARSRRGFVGTHDLRAAGDAADVVWDGLLDVVRATSGHILTTQTRFVAADLMNG